MKTILTTERLLLREMSPDDFDALYAVLADHSIMRYYPYRFDGARVFGWIEKNLDRYRSLGFGLWAVCLRDSGELIGDCGLTMQIIHGQIRPEIGYHIRADRQRMGYAGEAARAVRDWTFERTPFGEVYSYMNAENLPSYRTAMSAGMKQTDEYDDESGVRTKVFSLTRAEWETIREKNARETAERRRGSPCMT